MPNDQRTVRTRQSAGFVVAAAALTALLTFSSFGVLTGLVILAQVVLAGVIVATRRKGERDRCAGARWSGSSAWSWSRCYWGWRRR